MRKADFSNISLNAFKEKNSKINISERQKNTLRKSGSLNRSQTIPFFKIEDLTPKNIETAKEAKNTQTEKNLMKFKLNSTRVESRNRQKVLNYQSDSLSKAITVFIEKGKDNEMVTKESQVLSSPESKSEFSRYPSRSEDKQIGNRRVLSSKTDSLKTKPDFNTINTDRLSDKNYPLPNWMNKVIEDKNKLLSHRPSLTLSGNTISTNINASNAGINTPFKTGEALRLLRNKTINSILNNNASEGSTEQQFNTKDYNKKNFLPEIKQNNNIQSEEKNEQRYEKLHDHKDQKVLDYLRKVNKESKVGNNNQHNNYNEDNKNYQNFNISDLQTLEELKYLINKNNSNSQNENAIMNIVNNVNPKKTDKKVEINFNQYEIKIVPEKKKTFPQEDPNHMEENVQDERESNNSRGDSNLKKSIMKKLSLKQEKPSASPTKIVINKALSKKIVLKINNNDDMENLNINVNNSPKENISISLKTNKENESGSSKELKNSDSSTEAIQKNKKIFMNRLIEIPEKDDSKLDNSKLNETKAIDNHYQISNTENCVTEQQMIESTPIKLNYTEENEFETKDVASKDELKVNKLLKPFNKNFMRQLSKISEISNIISKGYDSNTANSMDSNPIIKMKNKVKEVKETLSRFNIEEMELRKNLQKSVENKNHTISDRLSSDQDSILISEAKEKDNLEKVIINNEEDNKMISSEHIKTDQIDSDKSKDQTGDRNPAQIVSSDRIESEKEKSDSYPKQVDQSKCIKKEDYGKSNNSSSNSSINHSPNPANDRRANSIKNIINSPPINIKNSNSKPKNRVRFSMIKTIIGEKNVETKNENFFGIEKKNTDVYIPQQDQKSEKWSLSELSHAFINKKCELEIYQTYRERKLKNLYNKFRIGIMHLYLKDQLLKEECDLDSFKTDTDTFHYNVNVKNKHSELLLSTYYVDSKFQQISLDYYLSKDFEKTHPERINLFENFDIYSTQEYENNFQKLMSRGNKVKEKIQRDKKKLTFKDNLKKTFCNVFPNEKPNLSLMNVIYYNKYLQLDLPENDMIEIQDGDTKKSKLIEMKMKSNGDINTLLSSEILTPKLSAAIVRRKSSMKLYEAALYLSKKEEDPNKHNKVNESVEFIKEVSNESNDNQKLENSDSGHLVQDINRPNRNDKIKDKKKLVNKKSNTTKMLFKKPPQESDFIQTFLPKKYSILNNLNFFDISDKNQHIVQNDRNWGQDLEKMINKRRMSLFTNLTNVYVKKYGKEKDDIEEVIKKSNKLMNKESMLFRTHEIKSNILKKSENDPKQALFFYIKDDNFQKFKEIIEKKKFSVEERDEEGNTLLNLAVQCNSLQIVDYMINIGADVNTQNNKLNTPLHYALSHKNFKIADMLIKRHADESIKNITNLTPWQCITNIKSIV